MEFDYMVVTVVLHLFAISQLLVAIYVFQCC